jgi:hypothetical protein
MNYSIKFTNPLTINVNVVVTQKEDDRVAQLQKELQAAISGELPEVQEKIKSVFDQAMANVTKVKDAVERNKAK